MEMIDDRRVGAAPTSLGIVRFLLAHETTVTDTFMVDSTFASFGSSSSASHWTDGVPVLSGGITPINSPGAAVPHNMKDLRWTLYFFSPSRAQPHTQGPPLLHFRDLYSCLPHPTNTYTLTATLPVTCHWHVLWAQLQSTPPSTPSVHPSSSRSPEVVLTSTTL